MLVDVVTLHESCSRLHARIAFDGGGTPWLRDLGSGNGTFVNGRRLPREACGKGEIEKDGVGDGKVGSRGVVVYPGDAIKFGASSRIYCLEGPEEFERGAKKKPHVTKMESDGEVVAAGDDIGEVNQQHQQREEETAEQECSWGMQEDAPNDDDDEGEDVSNNIHNKPIVPTPTDPNLPSIDTFFSSTKYKVTPSLQQLHQTYQSKQYKLQSIQTESHRISQKEDMGVELSDGQRKQLEKNTGRITTLEKEVDNLRERIEEGICNVVTGKSLSAAGIVNRRRKREEDLQDEEVDDFYDRTASSTKKQRGDDSAAESEETLIGKWKGLHASYGKQQEVITRITTRCNELQTEINSMDDEDEAFFVKNDLTLANDNLTKAKVKMEGIEKEWDETEYLLKIVNDKLLWDREDGWIGMERVEKKRSKETQPAQDDAKNDHGVSVGVDEMMPPPPMKMNPPPQTVSIVDETTNREEEDESMNVMPPPPPLMATAAKQQRLLGPMMPPSAEEDTTMNPPAPKRLGPLGPPRPPPSNNTTSVTTTQPTVSTSPPKKPNNRPKPNIQGTLAALQQAQSASKSQSTHDNNSKNTSQTKKKEEFDPRKDEWSAPVDQDGSGRTSLHAKFQGRY